MAQSPSKATAHLSSCPPSLQIVSKKRGCRGSSEPLPKRQKVNGESKNRAFMPHIAYWAEHFTWDTSLFPTCDETMSRSNKRSRSDSAPSGRNVHRQEYILKLEKFGIFMDEKDPAASEESCQKREELFSENHHKHAYHHLSGRLLSLLPIIKDRNEDRGRQDLAGWIVPCPELLSLFGEPERGLKLLRQEVAVQWIKCDLMGGTAPKPDFAVGFPPRAFSTEERVKLQNRTTCQVTPSLYFPFLISEVKANEISLLLAERQNVHVGAIAVRALVKLYQDAYGAKSDVLKREIYGETLCYSISHDSDEVRIHGHYAVLDTDTQAESYHRYLIRRFHLQLEEEGLKPYNFARNLYTRFSGIQLERIKKALLEPPSAQPAAELLGREVSGNRTPDATNETLVTQELASLRQQLQQQLQQHQHLENRLQEQVELMKLLLEQKRH